MCSCNPPRRGGSPLCFHCTPPQHLPPRASGLRQARGALSLAVASGLTRSSGAACFLHFIRENLFIFHNYQYTTLWKNRKLQRSIKKHENKISCNLITQNSLYLSAFSSNVIFQSLTRMHKFCNLLFCCCGCCCSTS